MSNTVISVENLWKEYRLGTINHGTLKADLASWWARRRGKADPNVQIRAYENRDLSENSTDRFWALREINFEVKQGEVLGIIGKNGAGKSTLLKILSRVTTPTRGQIKIKGRLASLLEVGTGFHPDLTGRENTFLNGAILGMNKAEILRKLDEIVAFAEVENFLDTPVKRYSSGMYVRLAFAVAAHLDPEILVVDEVLAVGDAEFQRKCLGKMNDVAKQGRTVLFVSHNMGAVAELCKSAVLLQSGAVTQSGDTHTIVDLYLGSTHAYSNKYVAQATKPGPYIKSVSLLQSDMNVGTFRIDRPISILLEIDARNRLNLVISIVVRNASGLWVHHTSSEFESNQTSEILTSKYCELPAHGLAAGRYFIDVYLAQRSREMFDKVESAVVLETTFMGIGSQVTNPRDWKGICGPGLLRWYS
jgi:lipopolysaccharide transport system ATP-binding protein